MRLRIRSAADPISIVADHWLDAKKKNQNQKRTMDNAPFLVYSRIFITDVATWTATDRKVWNEFVVGSTITQYFVYMN